MKKIILILFVILMPSVSVADISIASFNIQNWGWNNGKNNAKVGEVLRRFDIIAVQELMNDREMESMVERLNQTTPYTWQYMASHPIGRGSYKEQYGFIWNNNVSYVSGAVVYIDDKDVFAREPMSAKFKSNKTGQEFALANIHVIFGNRVSDRSEEIRALASYWDWLHEVYPETAIALAGDFNLWPSHEYFRPLLRKVTPAITQRATTISPIDGRYANLYDNIFYDDRLNVARSGIFAFPQKFGMTHEQARDVVSDHVPVYIILGNARVDKSRLEGAVTDVEIIGMTCIDINKSHRDDLTKLPRIGEARADEIIKGRPWRDVEDLTQIRGIGVQTVVDIRNHPELCD